MLGQSARTIGSGIDFLPFAPRCGGGDGDCHTRPPIIARANELGWKTTLGHMNTSVVHQHSLRAMLARSSLALAEFRATAHRYQP